MHPRRTVGITTVALPPLRKRRLGLGKTARKQTAPVEVFALNNGTEYIVEAGLEPGDVVIAEGAGLVREGAIVTKEENGDKPLPL